MFIQILIIVVVLIIFIFILRFFNKSTLVLNDNQVKYTLKQSDKKYFGKSLKDIHKLPEKGIFYTTTKWNPKTDNYFKYNNKYYMIEPGYYYNIIPQAEFFVNGIDIFINEQS